MLIFDLGSAGRSWVLILSLGLAWINGDHGGGVGLGR